MTGLTVGQVIANAARGTPSATAAVVDEQRYTFAQLDAAGDAVATRLVAGGLAPGDVALVFASTSFEMLAHYIGAARAGVIFAPANPGLDNDTLRAIAHTVQPAVVLAPAAFAHLGELLGLRVEWCSTSVPLHIQPLPQVQPHDPPHRLLYERQHGNTKGRLGIAPSQRAAIPSRLTA